MDYSKFNAEELAVAQQMLMYVDEPMRTGTNFRPDKFPSAFIELLEEYMSLDSDGRDEAWAVLCKEVTFKSYAAAIGNEDISDALMKVADDMAKMDSKSLDAIAKGGLSKMQEK